MLLYVNVEEDDEYGDEGKTIPSFQSIVDSWRDMVVKMEVYGLMFGLIFYFSCYFTCILSY